MGCCAECDNFHYESPQMDQPYPEFWCGEQHWDGITDYDELYEPIKCSDYIKTVK